jgi:hypothetical protein
MSISKINTNSIAAGASPTMTDLTLSGGIYLGGTGAANKIEDYEEGTFTPGFQYSTNGTHSSTFSEAFGYYRKIGGVVHCSIFVKWSAFSKGTASGEAQITGLPFSSAILNRLHGGGSWNAYDYPADTSKQFTTVIGPSATTISLYDVGSNTLNDAINDPDVRAEFKLIITYFTDA